VTLNGVITPAQATARLAQIAGGRSLIAIDGLPLAGKSMLAERIAL
jgi:hypothetical protein